jgi:formamidopyrimidine-DNA glycosylase
MPEILEVESYRRLADRVVGATIVRGWADAYSAKKLTSVTAWNRAVKNLTVTGTGRRGKADAPRHGAVSNWVCVSA